MLCQVCNKNDATLHYTKIIDGQVEELHLCEGCSKGNSEFDFDKTFSFHKLLTEIIDGVQGSYIDTDGEDLHCDKCGLKYSEFKQSGKLGCDRCYESFKDKLKPIIKSVQGTESHKGKIPTRIGSTLRIDREIRGLRSDLDKCISVENFEEAARLRDKIKLLEDSKNREGD